jgi:hypothetical protein
MESPKTDQEARTKTRHSTIVLASLLIISFLTIFGAVYLTASPISVSSPGASALSQDINVEAFDISPQVQLPNSYQLGVSYGSLGPQLLADDAIDFEQFSLLYEQVQRPLSPEQRTILQTGSDSPIVFDEQNAHFLLNFFWAVGLTNYNPILTEGLMMQNGPENVGRFASTGGWSLGKRPATELFASAPIVPLTQIQQTRLEDVAQHVYRPCCNNHTAFPDCNHGMAMLGLLTLLAGNDASTEEMFEAAKNINAFWYPQQAYETAVYFKSEMGLDYADVFPRLAVGIDRFSATGFQNTRQRLVQNNLLPTPQNGGNSCAVS